MNSVRLARMAERVILRERMGRLVCITVGAVQVVVVVVVMMFGIETKVGVWVVTAGVMMVVVVLCERCPR